MSEEPLKKGTKVSATVYGEEKKGVVTRDQKSTVVFVQWDGSKRENWMHRISLKVDP